jgi:hypothetical protein
MRTQPMRMLIDLLNNDLGYARIFSERDGFGYELTTYRVRPMPDLFERMGGYASAEAALEAAQQQLAAVRQPRLIKKKPRSRTAPRLQSSSAGFQGDTGVG